MKFCACPRQYIDTNGWSFCQDLKSSFLMTIASLSSLIFGYTQNLSMGPPGFSFWASALLPPIYSILFLSENTLESNTQILHRLPSFRWLLSAFWASALPPLIHSSQLSWNALSWRLFPNQFFQIDYPQSTANGCWFISLSSKRSKSSISYYSSRLLPVFGP